MLWRIVFAEILDDGHKVIQAIPDCGNLAQQLPCRMHPKQNVQPVDGRWLTIEEVRIVSDLRIMHAKVDELYQLVMALKRRHSEAAIVKYADQPILTEDIQKVDEIYLWFVRVKETSIAQRP